MFPTHREVEKPGHSLPHRRGDVSIMKRYNSCYFRSSPQAWGCFLLDGADIDWAFVFPTGVGMFRGY